ncbi:MAG: hypothetical protein KF715_07535 [Candidatus Didemnitutus sp.]|nr:hypothetical protein [Candidatus Didemnitutus sp.]
MSSFATRKCVRHVEREAVARCPSCGGDFCRECIVEHNGRVLCATCLAKSVAGAGAAQDATPWRRKGGDAAVTAACVLLLWIAFYGFGQFLKALPPDLHEGTVWRKAVEGAGNGEDR